MSLCCLRRDQHVTHIAYICSLDREEAAVPLRLVARFGIDGMALTWLVQLWTNLFASLGRANAVCLANYRRWLREEDHSLVTLCSGCDSPVWLTDALAECEGIEYKHTCSCEHDPDKRDFIKRAHPGAGYIFGIPRGIPQGIPWGIPPRGSQGGSPGEGGGTINRSERLIRSPEYRPGRQR